MHRELRKCYNSYTQVEAIESMVNWSGLCEQERCLTNVQLFTQYHYFRFYNASCGPDGCKRTMCQVRVKATDCWKSIAASDETKTFIKFVPDLSKTPPTHVKCPAGREKVDQRLNSVEGRVNSREKMLELYNMRDKIYHSRDIPFQWDIGTCVERSAMKNLPCNEQQHRHLFDKRRGDGRVSSDEEPPITTNATSSSRYDYSYELNSFVIVNPESDFARFWVAQIMSVAPQGVSKSSSACKMKIDGSNRLKIAQTFWRQGTKHLQCTPKPVRVFLG